jgi:N-acetylmuramoyl-L-alanine amidase
MSAEPTPRRGRPVTGDPVVQLALFLYAEAGTETVRTREAIAAAIANRVTRLWPQGTDHDAVRGGAGAVRSSLFLACVGAAGAAGTAYAAPPTPDDPLFASCVRIAKRAIAGALHDPTQGAVRFHEIGSRPAWAVGLNPTTWIGSFLFYPDDTPAADPDVCAGASAVSMSGQRRSGREPWHESATCTHFCE